VGDFSKVEELEGKRLATSYDGLLRGYLAERGIQAKVVRLDGAVESSVRLGVADAIADVVETGSTLKAAGMEIFGEPILKSEAVLIRRTGQGGAANGTSKEIEVLIRRLQGVLVARQYVLMDYDIRKELVEQAAALTPGLESPTVSPLRDSDWVAVRSMVPKKETNRIMDELYDLGARAILVSSIHACRI
jgi:ATP phosphoribosyltransferase